MTRPGANAAKTSVTSWERREIDAANESGRVPVVFVHGLWLLASSWELWRKRFEDDGYTTLAPGWPDDPDTVDAARARPEVFAMKSIGRIADHYEAVIRELSRSSPDAASVVHRWRFRRPRLGVSCLCHGLPCVSGRSCSATRSTGIVRCR
jgi:hypothetical protein